MALSQVKIEDCELSVRTARVLQENGYLTLGEVAEASDGQLLGLPQFGRRSLREIRDTIERFDKGGRERAAGKSIALAVFSLNQAANYLNQVMIEVINRIEVLEGAKVARRRKKRQRSERYKESWTPERRELQRRVMHETNEKRRSKS